MQSKGNKQFSTDHRAVDAELAAAKCRVVPGVVHADLSSLAQDFLSKGGILEALEVFPHIFVWGSCF